MTARFPDDTPLTEAVLGAARELSERDALPAYVYDLGHLDAHLAAIRAACPEIEVLHAIKANPEPALLAVIARHVDGLEVASGGELAHVRSHLPDMPLAFGGPGKTDAELAAALGADVRRYHVESLHELRRLDALARARGRVAPVLLRVNLPAAPASGTALTMGGLPSPFGMDPTEADTAAGELSGLSGVRFLGIHAHLASGLDSADCAAVAETILGWANRYARRHKLEMLEVNVGGGMAVDYRYPGQVFDWADYGRRMANLTRAHAPLTVRIEPGRAVSAYSGWYATRVLDLKRSHGEWFAVCAGGTHHLRTPAAKGHDQPFAVLPSSQWANSWPRQTVTKEAVTLVGQLCTPKDVLARSVPVPHLSVGDVVLFAMSGAYAYNISHHGFLMHPTPTVVFVPSS
ncbi:type III PLP-dependent enzyme [Amycolatopsis pigmentata]|uniref:Type III PLP-dependent enzyme n=1 Tax=Amycolatopsis pigmentata TaxID=450801 RepID=A0ABW5G2U1_9PSEU